MRLACALPRVALLIAAVGAPACAAASQRRAPPAARTAADSTRDGALDRRASVEPRPRSAVASFEAWLASSDEKSVFLATNDGRCEHMEVALRTGAVVEGRIAPHVTQSGAAVFSFYFEYASGRLTLRDPHVARFAGSSPHAALAHCEHPLALTGADAEAFSWSGGRWFRSAAACAAAVASGDARAMQHGACEPQLARVRAIAAQQQAPSPLVAVTRAGGSVFRLHQTESVAAATATTPAIQCVEWSFRPAVRDGARGAMRARWAHEDGAQGYTEFDYELGANTIMLLGPRTEVTHRPRGGGIGTVSFGCDQTRFVDVDSDGVVTAAGEPWFFSRAACERALRAADGPSRASAATASARRARDDC